MRTILEALAAGLVRGFFAWLKSFLDEKQATAKAREEGRREVRQEVADDDQAARDRAAAVPRPGHLDTVDRLRRGGF